MKLFVTMIAIAILGGCASQPYKCHNPNDKEEFIYADEFSVITITEERVVLWDCDES